ncbi:MAG: VOC family protein [Actinobacteria bacterium]|nr:VOC family protein [Actinomycetota bacterium]
MITVERVDFISVPTRDTGQARRFYGGLLGLPESTTPEDVYAEFETSNVTLGTWEPERDGLPFAPTAGIALRVPDVEAARRELEAAGVQFRGETMDTGVCHMAFCADFDGNGVILHRRYAEPRPDGMGHTESREREDARREAS